METNQDKFTMSQEFYNDPFMADDGVPMINEDEMTPFDVMYRKSNGGRAETDRGSFNYIEDLIHKLHPKKFTTNSNNSNNRNRNGNLISMNRPFNGLKNNIRRNLDQKEFTNQQSSTNAENNFYSNLGKQIASLVHNIDNNGNRPVNINIQPLDKSMQPVINENNFSSRSYWERFVRSLSNNDILKFLPKYQIKESNERLYDIENRVETTATLTTKPPLSLLELESMVNIMETSNRQLRNNMNANIMQSKHKLNINLYPKIPSKDKKISRHYKLSNINYDRKNLEQNDARDRIKNNINTHQLNLNNLKNPSIITEYPNFKNKIRSNFYNYNHPIISKGNLNNAIQRNSNINYVKDPVNVNYNKLKYNNNNANNYFTYPKAMEITTKKYFNRNIYTGSYPSNNFRYFDFFD